MSVKMEDISYQLQSIVEVVGIEWFLEICKMYGGYTLYISVYDKAVGVIKYFFNVWLWNKYLIF